MLGAGQGRRPTEVAFELIPEGCVKGRQVCWRIVCTKALRLEWRVSTEVRCGVYVCGG